MNELHPLINKKDSPHYDSTEEPAIQRFERKHSIQKLIDWAEITAEKYRDPARANKGEIEKDKRKLKSYTNYYNFLRSLVLKDHNVLEMTAKEAYKKHDIHWRYR